MWVLTSLQRGPLFDICVQERRYETTKDEMVQTKSSSKSGIQSVDVFAELAEMEPVP